MTISSHYLQDDELSSLNSTEFFETLEQNLIQDRKPQDLRRLIEGSERERRPPIANDTFRRLLHRSNWLVLNFLGMTHRFNMCSAQPLFLTRLTKGQKLRRLWASFTRPRPCFMRWPYLILIASVCALLRTTKIIYYQYEYDFSRLRLDKFREHLANPTMFFYLTRKLHYQANEYQLQLEQTMANSRRELRRLGALHLEWTIIAECLYLYVTEFGFFSQFVGPFWINYQKNFYIPWIRNQYDAEGQSRFYAKLIITELNHLIKSSRSFTSFRLKSVLALKSGHWHTYDEVHEHLEMRQIIEQMPEARVLFDSHLLVAHQLKQLTLRSRLIPLVNRSPAWNDRLALAGLLLPSFIYFYGASWFVVLYVFVERYFNVRGKQVELSTIAHWHTVAAIGVTLFVLLTAASFYCVTNPITLYEQLKKARCLRTLIANTVELNESRFWILERLLRDKSRPERRLFHINNRWLQFHGASLASKDHSSSQSNPSNLSSEEKSVSTSGRSSLFVVKPPLQSSLLRDCDPGISIENDSGQLIFRLIETIELDTLTALFHFKLFCSEYKYIRRSFDSMLFVCLFTVNLMPVIIRLHIPYLEVRARSITLCLVGAGFVPSFVLSYPFCTLVCRCLNVYQPLWSLLAQLSHFESDPLMRVHVNLEFASSYLRKQLDRPEQFARKFAARFAGLMDLTFPDLLRFQFWVSLIMISMFSSGDLLGGGLLQNFLADPFGVFIF